MAEVNRVTGPSGPQEPRKDKNVADAQKFRDLLKVEKVDDVDEDQKKKQKRKEQAEAEAAADIEQAQTATPPTPKEAEMPTQFPPTTGEVKEVRSTPPVQEPREPLPPPPAAPETGKTEKTPAQPQEAPPQKPPVPEKKVGKVERKEDRAYQKEPKIEKEEVRSIEEKIPTPTKKPEKKEEKAAESLQAAPLQPGPVSPDILPSSIGSTVPASVGHLHPLVFDLFEKMVGLMTVMSSAGNTETTITLNAQEYQGSVFFGSQIKIIESPTAPKVFNIEIISNPQGVALIQENTEDLMAAFQSGKYNFRVQQFTANIAVEKPLVRRKEDVEKEEKEEG